MKAISSCDSGGSGSGSAGSGSGSGSSSSRTQYGTKIAGLTLSVSEAVRRWESGAFDRIRPDLHGPGEQDGRKVEEVSSSSEHVCDSRSLYLATSIATDSCRKEALERVPESVPESTSDCSNFVSSL